MPFSPYVIIITVIQAGSWLTVIAAGMVLFYLIRMEPFTAMNRNLQGGRFDHADRLFSNVAATWDNCLHSSSDVKELTPEFYHQPEFLLNSNDFELGTQQVQSKLSSSWIHVTKSMLQLGETTQQQHMHHQGRK